MINGISWLVVTKLDVLDELAEIPVCVGYMVDGKKTMEIPAQASGYDKLECIYQKMPGWQTSTQGITKFAQLPKRLVSTWSSWRRKRERGLGWCQPGRTGVTRSSWMNSRRS